MWNELKNIKVFGINILKEKFYEDLHIFFKELLSVLFFSLFMSSIISIILMILYANFISLFIGISIIIFLLLICIFNDTRYHFKRMMKSYHDYKLLNSKIEIVEYLIIPESANEEERVEIRLNGEICTIFNEIVYRKDVELNILDIENEMLIIKKGTK